MSSRCAGRRKSILLVDHDAGMVHTLTDILQANRYEHRVLSLAAGATSRSAGESR